VSSIPFVDSARQGHANHVPELLVVHLATGIAEHCKMLHRLWLAQLSETPKQRARQRLTTNLREPALVEQGEEGREDLLLGEVAGGADDRDADGARSPLPLPRCPISRRRPIQHLCICGQEAVRDSAYSRSSCTLAYSNGRRGARRDTIAAAERGAADLREPVGGPGPEKARSCSSRDEGPERRRAVMVERLPRCHCCLSWSWEEGGRVEGQGRHPISVERPERW
jgi:hypothetical protein